MNPVFLLREIDALSGCKTALDVGTKDGRIAEQLIAQGLTVDAIDVHDIPRPVEELHFERISIENFLEKNTTQYDLVVARHVLHYIANPKEVIQKLDAISKVFFFTCFGPQDDWAGDIEALSHDEVLMMFDPRVVRHHSEAFQRGNTYAGEEKFWHINTFVIDKRK